jgi:sugar/nucleoside kinase (ribokinase family)
VVGPSIGVGSGRSRRRPLVVVVGAASRDLDPSDARGWRLGGTVTYASLALARLGLSVRVLIGVDDEAASAHELGLLLAAGAQIELARLASGPVFDNQYNPEGRRRQIAHSASARIPLRELPRTWRQPDAALLGPVADELGPAWADAFSPRTLVALGWQGLLRRLTPGQPVSSLAVRPLALIRRADIAVVSAEDVSGSRSTLEELLPHTGQQLAVTNGPRPLLHLQRADDGVRGRLMPVTAARSVRDTTGAGDVLLAAWCAGLASARAGGTNPPTSLLLAVAIAAAALKIEAGGLDAVPDLRALCERVLTLPGAETA